MNTDIQFELVAQEAIRCIKNESRSGHVTKPEKHIFPELCRKLYFTVKSFIPLLRFWKDTGLSRTIYILYLQYVLPLMFSDVELHAYFTKLLISLHNDVETWRPSGIGRSFKTIIGLVRVSPSDLGCRYKNIQFEYDFAYKEYFKNGHEYPQVLVDEALDCIRAGHTLVDNYSNFAKMFLKNLRPTYFHFLGVCIVPVIGEQGLFDYFKLMAQEYSETLEYYQDGNSYLHNICFYVFGHHFSRCYFTAGRKHATGVTNRIKALLLKAAFPYVYAYYATKPSLAYEEMMLTPEECEEYNKSFYSKKVTLNRFTTTKVPQYVKDSALPAGSTFKDVKSAIHRFYYYEIASGRVLPSHKQAIKEIRNTLSMYSSVYKDFTWLINNSNRKIWVINEIEKEEKELRLQCFFFAPERFAI